MRTPNAKLFILFYIFKRVAVLRVLICPWGLYMATCGVSDSTLHVCRLWGITAPLRRGNNPTSMGRGCYQFLIFRHISSYSYIILFAANNLPYLSASMLMFSLADCRLLLKFNGTAKLIWYKPRRRVTNLELKRLLF